MGMPRLRTRAEGGILSPSEADILQTIGNDLIRDTIILMLEGMLYGE